MKKIHEKNASNPANDEIKREGSYTDSQLIKEEKNHKGNKT